METPLLLSTEKCDNDHFNNDHIIKYRYGYNPIEQCTYVYGTLFIGGVEVRSTRVSVTDRVSQLVSLSDRHSFVRLVGSMIRRQLYV